MPLPMVTAGLSAWLSCCPETIPAHRGDTIYFGSPQLADESLIRAAAAYAVVLGLVSCHRSGKAFTPPKEGFSIVENLFRMMGMVNSSSRRPDPMVMDCFRRTTIVNCDNGIAQSTFTTLVGASAGGDALSCVISAVSSAYGPLHYGAQEATLVNLKEVGSKANIPQFLQDVKQKKRKLYGFGHRQLIVKDPRLAAVLDVLNDLNVNNKTEPLLQLAQDIEQEASRDDYFRKRGLSANADFYSVFGWRGMGFEDEMIVAANMAQRMIGLLAHWREAVITKAKLFRPSHVYVDEQQSRQLKARL
jgi:citrate synthase